MTIPNTAISWRRTGVTEVMEKISTLIGFVLPASKYMVEGDGINFLALEHHDTALEP